MNTLFKKQSEYRVLTLWQPWASLLVHGIKKIETRPAPTNWTAEEGVYLIHAASKWSNSQTDICCSDPFASELLKLGYDFFKGKAYGLPLGQIIGSIEVEECFRVFDNIEIDELELLLGDYSNGRYGWLCSNPRVLKEPISYKGGQGYYQRFKGDVNKLVFI